LFSAVRWRAATQASIDVVRVHDITNHGYLWIQKPSEIATVMVAATPLAVGDPFTDRAHDPHALWSYCVTNFDASSGPRLERRSMGIWIAL
jgi:hypothetical protein